MDTLYLGALQDIIDDGDDVTDRTGVGTRSLFGYQMRFHLANGFPAVTTKKLAWKAVVGELLWFLEGSTDERRLAEITYGKGREDLVDKTTIWTANADKQGVELGYQNSILVKELGPVYGAQWREFDRWTAGDSIKRSGVDQIADVINQIKTNPDSRRIILTAWNPNQTKKMALPPCHLLAHFKVVNGRLSCLMYQRSADMFLGVPFNIASYALLTHMIAQHCDLDVGSFIHSIGDAHIYNNHFSQVREQLARKPFPMPTLMMPPIPDFSVEGIKKLNVADFRLENYQSYDTIKAPMAV